MSPTPQPAAPAPSNATHDDLRHTVVALAELERRACSPAEREAAEWIAARLEELGCSVAVNEERAQAAFAPLHAGLSLAGVAAGLAALAGRRGLATVLGALAAAAIADDASNGLRPVRRALVPDATTWNVVAQAGDGSAERTLVVLAHHDAAPTGRIFDQSFQKWLYRRFPDFIERTDTALPIWWPVFGSPALVALGAATGRRSLLLAGLAGALGSAAAFLDIARSPIVPGANDNLSAVAVLVALAVALRERPVAGLRVVLASCGAEEVLQGGIHGFVARHLAGLDRERTWVLNLDTVGSPGLILLEGEGPAVMEDYARPQFRDLVARVAEREGIALRRGMRARSSTDAVITSRAGFATATVASVEPGKLLSNYHLMTDTPANLRYDTVAGAVALAEGVARELAPG